MTLHGRGSSLPDHGGRFHVDCLRLLHDRLQPETYPEIGTLHGLTLAFAQCASIAIDPDFQIDRTVIGRKRSLFLFQMTSDEFSCRHSAHAFLGEPVHLAFLDGMHLFEYLLRDFANTERCCLDKWTRSRSRYPLWWTGDVWKSVCILRRYRPDLTIATFNAPPTGSILVSNLDPTSCVLDEHYGDTVAGFVDLADEATTFDEYVTNLAIADTEQPGQVGLAMYHGCR